MRIHACKSSLFHMLSDGNASKGPDGDTIGVAVGIAGTRKRFFTVAVALQMISRGQPLIFFAQKIENTWGNIVFHVKRSAFANGTRRQYPWARCFV